MTFKLHYWAYLGHTNNFDLLKEHAVPCSNVVGITKRIS
jgi:hypothetical protein